MSRASALRLVPALAFALSAPLGLAACKSGDEGSGAKEAAPAEVEPVEVDDAGAAEGGAGELPIPPGTDTDGGVPAAATGEATGEATGGATGDPEAPDASGDADDAGETGEAEAAPEPEVDPTKALLDEVMNTRTKDARATAALEEAKKAGAEPNDLATAANKRGEKLMGNPERATPFFEWARAADPKFPNASFNLAKLAANTGESETVKELLQEVRDRGGKKLLKAVAFDPTFALVADDPEVLALTK